MRDTLTHELLWCILQLWVRYLGDAVVVIVGLAIVILLFGVADNTTC